jgi:hypothetical protein
VQPSRRADDSIGRQREPARRPVPVDQASDRLKTLVRTGSDSGEAYSLKAQRALGAYTGVSREADREYVSQMLGVDEFA